jgi:molybdopterin converting factor small subunit
MRITVHYMAQMRRAAGCAKEAVETPPGTTLGDLLRALADRHAALRTMLLNGDSEPSTALLFFVGEEHAEPSRHLHEGDAVTILAPMAGG